jgi:hypothetical protein
MGEAVQNVRILKDIVVIIVVDKIEIVDLPEDQQGAQYQNRIYENDERFFRRFGHD